MQEKRDWEFELSQYLDGQLSGKRLAEFEARLGEDGSLRELLRQYQVLEGRLAAMSEAEVPGADYGLQRETIMDSLERKALLKERVIRVPFAVRFSVGAFAAAALVAITALVAINMLKPGAATPSGSPMATAELTAQGEQVAVVRVEPGRPGTADGAIASLSWDDLRAVEPQGPASDTPPGTVVVSQGNATGPAAASMGFGFDIE